MTYTGFPIAAPDHHNPVDPVSSREGLLAALTEIEEFARAQDLQDWAAWLADARSLGDSPDPRPPYHDDLFAVGASLARRQLMAMAVRAWVFGGMGSWNDLGLSAPDHQGLYDHLTRRLHAAVLDALEVATNE